MGRQKKRTVSDKPRRKRPYAGAASLGLKVALVTAVLAAITIWVSATTAVVVTALTLWAALFVAMRKLGNANRRADMAVQASRDKYDSVIGALTAALDLDDDIRGDHVARVRELAGVLGNEMGMRKADICLLQKAALLADCGKVEIAQGILTKPGALTEAEWAEMKRHPEFGYEFLNSIRHLRDCGDIVRAHHERFDGQGYPRGLKGEDIPLGARIFSVVDAYTAMTSDRPHRKKMTHEMALKEILRNSLTQFDPEVVRAFQRCVDRGEIMSVGGEVPEATKSATAIEAGIGAPQTAASAA
jgi:HD-GYP domain-containing protein (c-di-GMP phosphodiesterase class II)